MTDERILKFNKSLAILAIVKCEIYAAMTGWYTPP